MKDYYVYAYSHPDTPKTYFYVGKGRWDRAWIHLSLVYRRKCPRTPFYTYLRELYKQRIRPVITLLLEDLTEKEAYIAEEIYIQKFGRKMTGGTLWNILPGGESERLYVRKRRKRKG